jgi:hypothetical protein
LLGIEDCVIIFDGESKSVTPEPSAAAPATPIAVPIMNFLLDIPSDLLLILFLLSDIPSATPKKWHLFPH